MYKALVIGCGNIGAGYDLENEHILTHTKAYHLNSNFELVIYDSDHKLAQVISEKYNCTIAESISKEALSGYDIVSICTPTNTHFAILNDAVSAGVKLIICEKPVSYDAEELNSITEIYARGHSKILVNYIRRFQPAYKALRNFISSLLKIEELTNVSVRYQRGFINNCSHAFDLIEYLTDKPIKLTGIGKHNVINDHFNNDPTLSLQTMWDNVNFDVLGLTNVQFSLFEIDLFFDLHKISISEVGNVINVYKAEKGAKNLQTLGHLSEYSGRNCMQDYMKYVINECCELLSGKAVNDNFIRSVSLNQKMLNYLSL